MEFNADRLHALRQTSPWGPGVVRLHINVSYFSTTVRRVTSPTWGPPPPCKQGLSQHSPHLYVNTSHNINIHSQLVLIMSLIERILKDTTLHLVFLMTGKRK